MSVILIGPSGVGKTTLLTTMLQHGATSLELNPTPETQTELEQLEQQWLLIHQHANFKPLAPLLLPTSAPNRYSFAHKTLELIIEDTVGNQLNDNEFIPEIQSKTVIITVIDAAALMETQPQPQANSLLSVFQEALTTSQKRLIIFALTKAETWLKTTSLSQQLHHAFEQHYQPVLAWLETTAHVVALYLPVNTLGCVEFSHIVGHGRQQQLIFVKKANLSCQPSRVEQVLCYSLAFILKYYQPRQHFWEKLGFAPQTTKSRQLSRELLVSQCDPKVNLYGNTTLLEQ
ncbi:MAG: hypothetical protein SVR94_09435 [Pseudomonadota bacterium]|nr:hypothetical protein [Pseudomonadota bacterium]